MNHYKLLLYITLLTLALGLAGCAAAATPPPTTEPVQVQVAQPNPTVTPTALPIEVEVAPTQGTSPVTITQLIPASTPPPGSEAVIQLAKADLAQQLQISPDEITVASVEVATWPDTSLGCPKPGMMYAAQVTPGFKVVLTARGESYEYHSDTDQTVIQCK